MCVCVFPRCTAEAKARDANTTEYWLPITAAYCILLPVTAGTLHLEKQKLP